jgi:hypothetical protein
MSDAHPPSTIPKTPAELAAQIPKDFGVGGVPPAIAETVEAMRRIMMQQSEENKQLKAEKEENAKIAKAEAEAFAKTREPLAKDVLAEFKKAVVEEGLALPSESYEKTALEMLTDNAPISQEHQLVSIACMRKMSKQDKVSPIVSSMCCQQQPMVYWLPCCRSWRPSRLATWSWRVLRMPCTR